MFHASRLLSAFFITVVAFVGVVAPCSIAAAQTDSIWAARSEETFVIEVNDAIERANGRPTPDRGPTYPYYPPPSPIVGGIAEVFHRFFSGVVPNSTGVERPSGEEHTIDDMEIPAGDGVSYVIMGAANNHMLTPLHFYQQFDGALALRYDVLRPVGGSHFRVALDFSPLAGSITTITRHNGVTADDDLPTSVILGGAVGVDAWYELPLVRFRARACALPGVDVINGGASGVEIVETVQMKWRLTEMFHWDLTFPIDLGIIAMHVDRGDARSAVYAWSGDYRTAAVWREVWQLMAIVEFRID